MSNRTKQLLVTGMIVFSTVMLLSPTMVHAFGPAKPPAPPVYTLPNPVRDVIVRPFTGVSAFETPNQVTTTLTDAVDSLNGYLDGTISAPGIPLSIVQGDVSGLDPCGSHLEIWPQVLDFELDSLSANISFGFNSSGTINVGQPQVGASDTVTMGNVSFLLMLYECDNATSKNCTSVLSATADQTVISNDVKFNVTWSEITASGEVFTKSDLGKDVQSILTSAVKKLVSSPQMAQAPWETLVQSVDASGNITMLAGSNEDISANQYFTVYSGSTNSCSAIEALACVYASEVNGPSSIAKVYKTLTAGASRPVQAGDIVEVGDPACAP